MLTAHTANSRLGVKPSIALAEYNHAPVRKLIHRSGGQPSSPIKELALLPGYNLPHAWSVIEHTAVQLDVLASGYDFKQVELQALQRAQSLLCTFDSAPVLP